MSIIIYAAYLQTAPCQKRPRVYRKKPVKAAWCIHYKHILTYTQTHTHTHTHFQVDPFTGRVTECYASAACCRPAGGPPLEERLAAVTAHALPEHAAQLDTLPRRAP